MELSNINETLVRRLIEGWIADSLGDLNDLNFIFLDGIEYDYRLDAFVERLRAYTVEQLTNYRQLYLADGWQMLPETDLITLDKRVAGMELQYWSILYFTFFYAQGIEKELLAEKLNLSKRTLERRLSTALGYLARYLRKLESEAMAQNHTARLKIQVPSADYRQLFGDTDKLVNQILSLYQGSENLSFVSIEGLGGIGKTALAREVVQAMVKVHGHTLRDVIWISARQDWFNERGELLHDGSALLTMQDILAQLSRRLVGVVTDDVDATQQIARLALVLSRHRYLIVIDNLETIKDFALLLPELLKLEGQTCFLLTSRQSLSGFARVQTVSVPELSVNDSKTLLLAQLRKVSQSKRQISASEVQAIVDVVGGVPLALKLIASQIVDLPVQVVLENLQKLDPQTSKENRHMQMFRYIYRQTWQQLSAPSKRLLMTMVNISVEGTVYELLAERALSLPLEQAEFEHALDELHHHSLLEVRGHEPRYSLHRLTTTFLKNDILGYSLNVSDEDLP